MIKYMYVKKDWLGYAEDFDYSNDLGIEENNLLKKQMLNWSIKDFQNFYGFKGFDEFGYHIKTTRGLKWWVRGI